MNPGFNGIHPEPIARHLQPLMDEMRTGEYWVGLATDGDADRIGAVDPDGRFIDPHAVMALLLEHLVHSRGLARQRRQDGQHDPDVESPGGALSPARL